MGDSIGTAIVWRIGLKPAGTDEAVLSALGGGGGEGGYKLVKNGDNF